MTKDDYAREVLRAGRDLGVTPRGIVIAFATVSVECDWVMYANAKVPESLALPHERVGSDGFSVGLFQQQIVKTANGYWWSDAATCMDPYKSAALFFGRLKKLDYNNASRSPGSYAQAVQQSAFPDRYDQRMSEAQSYYNQISGTNPEGGVSPRPGWRGDPTFLPEVLRAEGLTVKEIPGWRNRGHGDFNEIFGVIAHHTGSNSATAESIAFHPSLGLASQIHLGRDGAVTLCGVGIAWHAGNGSHAGLPRNDANRLTIGIEAANDGGGSPGKPHRSSWPDAQYNAYVKTVAAILRFLGHDSSRVISHKEWAGAAQGKWDPGAIDMDIFRADVQAQINSKTGDDFMSALSSDEQRRLLERTDQIWGALFNPVNSRSKYKAEGEGAIHKTKDLVLNIDGMTHETLIERQAMMGNAEALALVKREADRGDKWAKVVLRYVEGE